MTVQHIDVGGTWIRVRDSSQHRRLPTPSKLRHPHTPATVLLDQLIELLATLAPPYGRVAMAFGAAMDDHTGIVYGSSPLWGDELRGPVNVAVLLSERRPDVHWFVVNDLTGAVTDFATTHARPNDRHVTYLTISSGVALRTADLVGGTIPVDTHGLQGEVGHLPAITSHPQLRTLRCACGGRGHVAAICSGPALVPVARALGLANAKRLSERLDDRVHRGDPDAQHLLAAVVEPIAELIRTLWCLDPHTDLTGLGGGVVEALTDAYEGELIHQLAAPRSYSDVGGAGHEATVRHKIRVCRPGDVDPAAGAAALSRRHLTITK